MGNHVEVLSDKTACATLCRSILEGLPDWFGQPDSIEQYVKDAQTRPTFIARVGDDAHGFMALTHTSKSAVDIHVMGVAQAYHGQGLGRALIEAVLAYARAQGATFLTVKTLGPSCNYQPCEETRRFYEAVGFELLDEFPDL